MFPKKGNKLPPDHTELAFAALMAEALARELGMTHQAVKIAMRWTGASDRTVKHWLAGTHAPRGMHLLELMRHSDEVLRRLLVAAGRGDVLVSLEAHGLREKLAETVIFLDTILGDDNHAQ